MSILTVILVLVVVLAVVLGAALLYRALTNSSRTYNGGKQPRAVAPMVPAKYAVLGDGIVQCFNTIDNDTVTGDTPFRIGSLTKIFTALCLLAMERDGKMRLSDPIAKYTAVTVPGLTNNITIMDVINHKSGMFALPSAPFFPKTTDATSAFKGIMSTTSTGIVDPSKYGAYNYSNPGYILLGHVIENVTCKHYMDAFKKYLFVPAGISPTIKTKIKMYNAKKYVHLAPLTQNELLETNFATTAGALCCSVNDLAKFIKYAKAQRLLLPEFYFYAGEKIVRSGGIPGGDSKLMFKNDDIIIRLEAIGYLFE